MYWFAQRLGDLLFVGLRFYRRRAVNQLLLTLGKDKSPSQVQQIVHQSFAHWIKCGFEVVWMAHTTPEAICRRVRIEGLHHLEAALARGKGVIHLGAHLGNFPLIGVVLAQRGYHFSFVVRDPSDTVVAQYFHYLRTRLGLHDIPRDATTTAAFKILRSLKNNQIVSLIADQHAGRDGVVIDFFGHPVSAATGPAFFALRTGASLLPMFAIRRSDESHVLFIDPPIELSVTGNQEQDLLENTIRCMRVIESYIRRYPSQWSWFARRWRTDPQGDA